MPPIIHGRPSKPYSKIFKKSQLTTPHGSKPLLKASNCILRIILKIVHRTLLPFHCNITSNRISCLQNTKKTSHHRPPLLKMGTPSNPISSFLSQKKIGGTKNGSSTRLHTVA